MAIRSTDDNHPSSEVRRLRRKSNQAWDMAGLARQDGDKADEQRCIEEARRLDQEIAELKQGERDAN